MYSSHRMSAQSLDYSSDWERRFSTIVRDTEVNLAKIKTRLGTMKQQQQQHQPSPTLTSSPPYTPSSPYTSHHHPHHHTSTTTAHRSTSPPYSTTTTTIDRYNSPIQSGQSSSFHEPSRYNNNNNNNNSKSREGNSNPVSSTRWAFLTSTPSNNLDDSFHSTKGRELLIRPPSSQNNNNNTSDIDYYHHSNNNNTVSLTVTLMQDKIEQQNKTIDGLRKIVDTLDRDRDRQYSDIHNLQDEIRYVNSRMCEYGSMDTDSVKHVDLWRRDLMADMASLQTQFEMMKQQQQQQQQQGGGRRNIDEELVNSLTREIQDSRRTLADECTSLKNDIESIKTRLLKMEVEHASQTVHNKEMERRNDRLDNKMTEMTEKSSGGGGGGDHTSHSAGTGSEKDFLIDELRQAVRELNQRLKHVETQNSKQQQQRNSIPSTTTAGVEVSQGDSEKSVAFNMQKKLKYNKSSSEEVLLSDIDLSQTDDIVLTAGDNGDDLLSLSDADVTLNIDDLSGSDESIDDLSDMAL